VAQKGVLVLLARVLETISEHQLISPGQRVLVGLSGGPDSWALLLALQRLSAKLQIQLHAACVDHGLRDESAQEAADVSSLCASRGIPCTVVKVDVKAKRLAHVSWQDAARRARLEALLQAATVYACDVVALGHNANDQAETVLFRIVRGTGVRGLSGIPYKRDRFVRPLLDVRRVEIERFIAKSGVSVVRDPTNLSPRYARVRVRQEWLPALAKENPKVIDALLALAADARKRSVGSDVTSRHLPAGAPASLSRRQTSLVDRMVRKGGTSRLSVKGGAVLASYGHLSFVSTLDMAISESQAKLEPIEVDAPRQVIWGTGTLLFENRLAPPQASDEGAGLVASFDAEKIVWPLTVRCPGPGDRIRPRGGLGSRKLQDVLVDAKVPRPRRARLPVVLDAEGTVLFVPGVRPAEVAKPTAATRSFFGILAKNFVISPK
jgi:tRNA(Ile)-lysidine synthase